MINRYEERQNPITQISITLLQKTRYHASGDSVDPQTSKAKATAQHPIRLKRAQSAGRSTSQAQLATAAPHGEEQP